MTGPLPEGAHEVLGNFADMRVDQSEPDTVIHCTVVDTSQLHGILVLFETLGLHLISLQRVPG